MNVPFFVLQMLVCVRTERCAAAGGRARAGEARCDIVCLMSSAHLKPCVKCSRDGVCEDYMWIGEGFF